MTTTAPQYYAILLHCIYGDDFTCKDENENPTLFTSEEKAWKEIADSMVINLQQFIAGERDLNDTNFEPEETAVPVTVTDGKIIYSSRDNFCEHELAAGTEPTID